MYQSRITREHRTAFVLLCDRSGSMSEEIDFRNNRATKAAAVATIINEFIDELINRCRRVEGVRNYFDIALLEYSGDGVVSLLSPKGDFATVEELVRRPVEVRHATILRTLPTGNQVTASTTYRCWIEPKAVGNTPMGEALHQAEKMVRGWCARKANHASFPPIIINITDGEASDANERQLYELSERLRSAKTSDGNALLFNIHLASSCNPDSQSVSFPASVDDMPPLRYARLLYDMSSTVPECYNDAITLEGFDSASPLRAMSFNCSVEELFRVLKIGSHSVSLIS